jgi:K+-sensing histidine kinase KdpD
VEVGMGDGKMEGQRDGETERLADKARSRSGALDGGGAGLGLSIARWIAEAHDGRLELARSDESGSAFIASFLYQAPADLRGTVTLLKIHTLMALTI